MRTSWLTAVAAVSLCGCSLADAIFSDSGGDNPGPGNCDPRFNGCEADQCGDELDLGQAPLVRDFNSCEFDADADFDVASCDGASTGFDLVWSFRTPSGFPEMVEICTDSTVDAVMMYANQCSDSPVGVCLALDGNCVEVPAEEGDQNFIVWARRDDGNGNLCGNVRIEVKALGGNEGGGGCLDGVDNDSDGRTDCEDPKCVQNFECQRNLEAGEVCNGSDDGNVPPFPIGFIDESACACVDDKGCDQINPGPDSYRCHFGVNSPVGEGVCNPDCRTFDWCANQGTTCGTDGTCLPNTTGSEICLDGVDNDADGDTDCEDSECRNLGAAGPCEAELSPELCDGIDQAGGVVNIPGTVDDFACKCDSDLGCDKLLDVGGNPFLCHKAPGALPEPGICNPRCIIGGPDWCPQVALICQADGLCR